MTVLVVDEGRVPVDDVVAPLAPDDEGVTDDAPLRLVVEGQHLARVVYQPREVEPVVVRVVLPDAFGRLEGVHDVGDVHVRIALVHQLVETFQGLAHRRLEVVELGPLVDLGQDEVHRLVRVHLLVGPAYPLLDRIVLVHGVVTELLDGFLGEFRLRTVDFRRVDDADCPVLAL